MLEMHPCSGTVCQIGSDKVGNQAKPLNYSEKKNVFCTNLEQMFKRTATDLDKQPKRTQQRLT